MDAKIATPAQRRRSEPSDQDESNEKRKVGFLLTPETDFKLTVYARKMRRDRSSVVEECLEEKLSGVTVSFRGKSKEAGEGG